MTKTYAQLTREIQALQAHADKLHQSEKKEVIAKLNESIAQYGLSAQDLRFPGSSGRSSPLASSSSTRSARTGASSQAATALDGAKYSDGQGRIWGGRGPRPVWLREAIAQGRSLESFATTTKATRGATTGPASAKVSLPPLYGHPKTGQTWSGRGPKPAWLKQSLKKRGTSINDFLISAAVSAPTGQTPAPAQSTLTSGKGDQDKRGTPRAGVDGQAAKKPRAKKAANHTQAAPVTATKTPASTPAKKSAAAKSTPSGTRPASTKTQKNPKAAGKADMSTSAHVNDAQAASSKPIPASPAVSAKKSASKTDAKGSKIAKPQGQKPAPAKKNLPTSMAPPSEPAPVPTAEPVAPSLGSESSADENQTTSSSN